MFFLSPSDTARSIVTIMVNERQRPMVGVPRFQGRVQPSVTASASPRPPQSSRASQLGLGLGKGVGRGGVGLGNKTLKRHRKVPRDSIQGISKGDIRRIARRGGVKRISANIYHDVRHALKSRLEFLLRQIVAVVESSGRKIVSVTDVIFILNRNGSTIYGFDPTFDMRHRT